MRPAERFTWALPLILYYCAVQMALYSMLALAYPETFAAAMAVVGGHAYLACARACLHKCFTSGMLAEDDARWLFSCVWLSAYVFVDSSLALVDRWALLDGRPSPFTARGRWSVELMVCVGVLQFLQGFYMNFVAIDGWSRLACTACNVALWASLGEGWSVLAPPSEPLLVASAHVAGELWWRLQFAAPRAPLAAARKAA